MMGARISRMGSVSTMSINRLTSGMPLGNNFNVIIIKILPNLLDENEYLFGQIKNFSSRKEERWMRES